MERITLEVDEKQKVQIELIGGDLRISGRKGLKLEAQAPDEGNLMVEQVGDQIMISCRSGCLIYLPSAARIDADQIGGDARITGLSAELMIRSIGGDLSLSRVGRSTFEMVGGDLTARKMMGDLTVDRVGGDAVVEQVDGEVRLRAVGGDLLLRKVKGLVDVAVGGDASVEIRPEVEKSSVVVTGGDLACWLPKGASTIVKMQAGGDLMKPADLETEETDEGTVLRLGDGEGSVELSSGGDLWLQVGERDMLNTVELLGDIESQVEASVAEVEARVAAMVEGAYAFDAERIGERVRRSVARARRRAERARRRSTGYADAMSNHIRKSIQIGGFVAEEQAVSEEERMTILRMVEQGKIDVEEAEKLLKALEGEA
ncbi:MAG: hypothetical protein GTO14_19460 [Anaerolineales bacterium]|nr:hypothetical protein [Anaerolineales bacterium]